MTTLELIVNSLHERLISYKNSVEKIAQFTDVLWVVADDNEEQTKIIFNRDMSLTVSRNGQITKGTYEVLTVANSLIITIDGESKLYNHITTTEGLIYLQFDNQQSSPFVMVDNNLLEGKTVYNYLFDKYTAPQLSQQKAQDLELKAVQFIFPNSTDRWKICQSGGTNRYYVVDGRKFIAEGTYRFSFHSDWVTVIKVVAGGEVEFIYDTKEVLLKNGRKVVIQRKSYYPLEKVNRAYFEDGSLVPDGRHKVSLFKSLVVRDGALVAF